MRIGGVSFRTPAFRVQGAPIRVLQYRSLPDDDWRRRGAREPAGRISNAWMAFARQGARRRGALRTWRGIHDEQKPVRSIAGRLRHWLDGDRLNRRHGAATAIR